LKALKTRNEEEVTKLKKDHEGELANFKRDRETMVKTMSVMQGGLDAKDARIKALAKDNEAALTELAALRRDKEKLESEKDGLEVTIGEQYEEGFQSALEQVKVLFPDIDKDLLGKADAMLAVEDGKLVSPASAEVVQETPDHDSTTKDSPAEDFPATE
jgi:hypothetical protein